jgi:hypothetical protein
VTSDHRRAQITDRDAAVAPLKLVNDDWRGSLDLPGWEVIDLVDIRAAPCKQTHTNHR